MLRLTINLPDDLYAIAMARSHAVANRKSISKAIADLLRRPSASPDASQTPEGEPSFSIDPVTWLPVVRWDSRTITMEDIKRSIEDGDVRHPEMTGLSAEEIERALGR